MNTQLRRIEDISRVGVLSACEQCGRCSSACPICGINGFNIRRILRHVELGIEDEISNSPLPWSCAICGRCEDACPNTVEILDIIRSLRARSPIQFIPERPPCILACPAKVDIPGYLRLIAHGRIDEAYKLILEKVPLPGVLGRVCTHPCEDSCKRGEINQSISICALKRFAADCAGDIFQESVRVKDDNGHKVAVVGAGPAGLTVAFLLRRKGYQVTIIEERSKPGGMMRYGIPAFRLPESVLDQEISRILSLGIDLRTNTRLGTDTSIKLLKREGFEVVFLATGLWQSKKIHIEGAESSDVLWGLDFLVDISEGNNIDMGSKVLVVGGGNVAIDVALSALRLGASEVTLACLESREEMPANPWEVELALEEDVNVLPSWGPKRIIRENGKLTGIELIQCTSVFDENGAFSPTFGELERIESADQIILAIGQTADLSFLDGALGQGRSDLIKVDPDTHETSEPGVFAGGDAISGPSSIIQAIASGRRAAKAIDRYLEGKEWVEEHFCEDRDDLQQLRSRVRGFSDLKRVKPPILQLSERLNGFVEIEQCLAKDQAIYEANRCLNCDLEAQLAREGRFMREEGDLE